MVQGKLSGLFIELGRLYAGGGMLQGGEQLPNGFQIWTRAGADVHACYRLSGDPKNALHVRGHLGKSTDSEAAVSAELANYEELMRLWDAGASVEDGRAVVRTIASQEFPIKTPYDAAALQMEIGKRCRDIR